MGIRRLFTGLCRKGIACLPTRMYSQLSAKTEANENDHIKHSSIDLNEVTFPNNNSITNQDGEQRLRIVSLIGLLLSLLTVFFTVADNFKGADSPQCRSIYMYPSYARIDGFDSRFTPLAQKYHLYLYREQGKDKIPFQDGRVQLDGIPVLFIPGNAGSFKQVRSIAAASSNLFFDNSQEIENLHVQNLDFFAADFNEDFTAFHGRTMLDQAEYLNDAIRYILLFYAKADSYPYRRPTSVIVVGHSMGGIVARILPTLQNHVADSVRTILTLSSPHAAAPVTFDGDVLKIYERTDDFWRKQMSDKGSFLAQNVTLISITGGILDLMLPADYTAVEDIVPLENGFTTYSTGVPGVWTPVDHLAIVWCDQLRTKIAKLLLEIVDNRAYEKVLPLAERMSIFRKTFLSKLEGINSPYLVTANFDEYFKDYNSQTFGEPLILKNNQQLIINQRNVKFAPKYSKFLLSSDKENSHFSFLTSLSNSSLFFCNEGNPNMKCVPAAPDLFQVPASFEELKYPAESSLGNDIRPFQMISIDANILSQYDSILVETPLKIAGKDDFILAALHTAVNITVNKNPLQLAFSGKEILLTEDFQFVGLRFPKLWDSLLSYRIHCSAYSKTEDSLLFQPFIRQWIEDPFETKWHINVASSEIDINMHNVAPFIPLEESHDRSLKLDVVLPPRVGLKLRIRINWQLTLKMLFIRYRLTFLSFPFAIVCFTMAHQFSWYQGTGKFIGFNSALAFILEKYGLLISFTLILLSPITNYKPIQRLLFMLDPVGLNRPFQLENQHMHTNFYYLGIRSWFTSGIGLFFGLMSVAILYLIAEAFDLLHKQISKITIRSISKISRTGNSVGKVRFMNGKRLLVCLLLTGAVNFYIPYQLAAAICLLIQVVNYIKTALISSPLASKDEKSLKDYNFAILLLLIFMVVIDAPTIIVFLHNFAIRWETPFRSHHNVLAVAPTIFLVSANSAFNIVPFKSESFSGGLITVLLLGYASFFSLIYGARNLYWIHHLVNIICAWLLFTICADTSDNKHMETCMSEY
ncbi:hypothetical protein HG536_0B06550 [Torulaspora globosa]|uniref:GPI inositol-deacylase n=1 Tax=Torulaspora globosa TaxID=48254 RepID=A0A7G3ZE51_9SACH|nr:uncharacterized protein HG536_0B06550 [Torulaspora globosa]QLL31787.1 hypothetical protein HG536_0B06550 [Torulaspora globosa]